MLHLTDPKMMCSIVRVAEKGDDITDLLDHLEKARILIVELVTE